MSIGFASTRAAPNSSASARVSSDGKAVIRITGVRHAAQCSAASTSSPESSGMRTSVTISAKRSRRHCLMLASISSSSSRPSAASTTS